MIPLDQQYSLLAPFGWQDRFELVERIGKGAMGQVWKAWEKDQARWVALKLLVSHRIGDLSAVARVEAEGITLMRLNADGQHPNVVPIFDFAVTDDHACLVMKFIPGKTLGVMIEENGLDMISRIRLMAKVAHACGWFHQLGIIHRDLKPENILIHELDSEPVILDFSIAKDQEALMSLTVDQDLGTAAYMAPEQFGIIRDKVTPATDVYALGAMLYELITESLPFPGNYLDVLNQKLAGKYPALPRLLCPGMPCAMEAIVWKTLAYAPTSRYQDGQALAEDLDRFLTREKVQAPTPCTSIYLRHHLWQNRWKAIGGISCLAGMLSGWLAWPLTLLVPTITHQNTIPKGIPSSTHVLANAQDTRFPLEADFIDLFAPDKLAFWKDNDSGGIHFDNGIATTWTDQEDPVPGVCVYTQHAYTDYVLRFQYLADEPGSDSGIFIGCRPQGNGLATDQQIQVGHQKGRPTGSLVGIEVAKPCPERGKGIWNDMEITVQGKNITVLLNGEHILNHTKGYGQLGYLAIQTQITGPIKYRHMRLHPLQRPAALLLPDEFLERLQRDERRRTGKIIHGIDDVFPPLVGMWFATMKSGRTQRFLIHGNGRIRLDSLDGRIVHLRLDHGHALLHAPDKIQRFSLLEKQLYLEQWSNKDQYGKYPPDDTGYADRVDTPTANTPAKEAELLQTLLTMPQRGVHENMLGMRFVPLQGLGSKHLACSIWETRVRDYAVFTQAESNLDESWLHKHQQGHPISRKANDPVCGVSWHDAWRFCHWLTMAERKRGLLPRVSRYRLPTDMEWSVAAGIFELEDFSSSLNSRSTSLPDVFPWGTGFPPPNNAGNYADISLDALKTNVRFISGYRDGHPLTSPVGSYAPNALGIYDLGGNVWEWCEDIYGPGTDPNRVLRGGGFFNYEANQIKLAFRRENGRAQRRTGDFGFRIILEIKP